MIHLVTGNVGAGKTTYAIALANRVGGVRFSIDDWLQTLFYPDKAPGEDLPWTLERIDRVEAQVWKVIAELAPRGVDAVLDLGLSKRAHRDAQRARAANLVLPVKLHFLDVPLAARTARVKKRNDEKRETFAFEVTAEMIAFMETYFEAPDGEELEGAEVVR